MPLLDLEGTSIDTLDTGHTFLHFCSTTHSARIFRFASYGGSKSFSRFPYHAAWALDWRRNIGNPLCYYYSNHSTAFSKGKDGLKWLCFGRTEYASVCFTAFHDVLMHMVVQRRAMNPRNDDRRDIAALHCDFPRLLLEDTTFALGLRNANHLHDR